MFRRYKAEAAAKEGSDSGSKYRSSLTGKGAKYSLGGDSKAEEKRASYTSKSTYQVPAANFKDDVPSPSSPKSPQKQPPEQVLEEQDLESERSSCVVDVYSEEASEVELPERKREASVGQASVTTPDADEAESGFGGSVIGEEALAEQDMEVVRLFFFLPFV